jgi:Ca2+-transporting ATPase
MPDWGQMSVKEVLVSLKTGNDGISENEARLRLIDHGRNEIVQKHKFSALSLFFSQFTDFLIILLLFASIVSFATSDPTDGIIILCIVAINAIIGFVQEYKAEKSLAALRSMISLKSKVIRNGTETVIDRSLVVPGDIIMLDEGDKIPADARLLECYNLSIDESCLTGESVKVRKDALQLKEIKNITEAKNMVFMGTNVATGRAKAIVVATGMETEFGKIARLTLESKKEMSPLQQEVSHMGKIIARVAIVVCIIVFLIGVFLRGQGIIEMFTYSISIAVAVVPEGLPTVLTVALAMGVRKMARKNSIVKKLASVETLGSTTVICTDKTGTITKNEMTVKRIFASNRFINISGEGYNKAGKFSDTKTKDYEMLLKAGILCNNASFQDDRSIGDPTEIAILVAAAKVGIEKEQLEREFTKLHEIPFSSERKMMTAIYADKQKRFAFVKGAPREIVSRCNRILVNGKVKALNSAEKERLMQKDRDMAETALRVLGTAYREVGKKENPADEEVIENKLIFLGFFGMIDPPRDDVAGAIGLCRQAGINVIMITGDQKTTAKAVAKQIGLISKDEEAITGEDLKEMTDDELFEKIKHVKVFARTSPSDKLRIIAVLRKHNQVIAMTGDGVNDAPALKKSDIGVAMGITGTDVSKEASHMVITDDSFTTIVSAVEEGRGIYDNIKKFVLYNMTGIASELFIILVGIFASLPLPLTAIQILLVDMGTEIFPSLALGLDNHDANIMQRKPRDRSERMMNKEMILSILSLRF